MKKKYTKRDSTSKPYVRKNDRKSGVREDERLDLEIKASKPIKYKPFHVEFKNQMQKVAWGIFQEHEVMFLLGSAGTAKTFLSVAFAISELLAKKIDKIIITRPVVEAGESLGFLPGTLEEKIDPYLKPIINCIDKLVGKEGPQREMIDKALDISPLAYMRGSTFDNAICILDEAQNATKSQLKMFLTRKGENCRVIVTGDSKQSDLQYVDSPLMDTVRRLERLTGVGIVEFQAKDCVRDKMVMQIINALED